MSLPIVLSLSHVGSLRQLSSHPSPKPIAIPILFIKRGGPGCHVTHYIYRSLVYLSITLRYRDPFGLDCNSPVQGQVITLGVFLDKPLLCIYPWKPTWFVV
ncbi:hypothetical protein ACN42_g9637 [Penicillium freii]|uniref:Uncharacterized protein n=1 Tax=Penicillium freii TaxID=48697 RepID=A0A101MBJ5_PENFR|nr:hypothetical protein ACN42_g9637 [Penicillium freii]